MQNKLGQASEILIPGIALGEMYYGARKSGQVEVNVQRVNELAASSAILDCDAETARHYATIHPASPEHRKDFEHG